MSFLEQLQTKRKGLKPTSTIVTTATGERFLENKQHTAMPIKLEKLSYGFVEDTKPDTVPAEILPNFLYLGSQDAVSMENVETYKLTHILSVGVNVFNMELQKTVKHKFLPLLDLPETRLFEGNCIVEAFEFITTARQYDGRILVHCNAGVSRAASIVIAYLIGRENFNFEEAYAVVKSKRECIQPNAGFLQQLRQFRP